jgi:hypothetical protein
LAHPTAAQANTTEEHLVLGFCLFLLGTGEESPKKTGGYIFYLPLESGESKNITKKLS